MRDIGLLLRDIIVGSGFILWITLQLPIKMIEFAWKKLGPKRATAPRRLGPKPVQEIASIQVAVPAATREDLADQGPVTILQASAYEVADRIVGIRLDPPVGVINLRVYTALAKVKRDLIISEPRLKAMMRGRRHAFPDVDYDPVKGLEATKEETIALAEKLINELGNLAVTAHRSARGTHRQPTAPMPSETRAPQSQQQQRPTALPNARPNPSPNVFEPRPTNGITYVGRLISAQPQEVRPPGRNPYEIFEVTLELDNGATLPLRGAELERELLAAGCEVGQRVAITPMGKVPVTLADGGEGRKNLYQVKNMSAGPKSRQHA
jgi:hypothetical protein